MRFRSKPMTTVYVEALFDSTDDTYSYQQVDGKTGKAIGEVSAASREEFDALYDPLVRKPRATKKAGTK